MNNVAEISLWQLVLKGGWLMVPIALCSLLGIAFALELALVLRRRRLLPRDLEEPLRDALRRQDTEAALRLCDDSPSPLSHTVRAGLAEAAVADWDHVERAVEDAASREIDRLRAKARPLRIISEICPLLGLLGTIQGMMGAFQSVSASGGQLGKTEMFAGDIFTALVTTAAGLVVAIPALFLYYAFARRIDALSDAFESSLTALFSLLRTPAPDAVLRGN